MSAEDFVRNAIRTMKRGQCSMRDAVDHYRVRYEINFGEALLTMQIALGDYNEGIWR